MNIIDGLTFDDVLLVPKYSEIESRSHIDLSVELSKDIKTAFPVIPANMQTITGIDMVNYMYGIGGLPILHRFMSLEKQFEVCKKTKVGVGFSVGIKKEDYATVDEFANFGVKVLCVDVAHGHTKDCLRMTSYISKAYPDIFLIAGNVATGEGAIDLWKNGADAVKCGVGSGSLCSTRIETGAGYPQLSALENVWMTKSYMEQQLHKKLFVISDGGATTTGNIVKALCFSDLVMSGHFFAGCTETPGEEITIDGDKYKRYVGSSTHKTNHIEGVEAIVKSKGPVKNVVAKISDGIRSGLSYQGCKNLTEIKMNPQFVRITSAGLKESHPHDVMVTK